MSKTGGVLQSLSTALRNLGIKAPWKYTGPVSSPEYQSHLPRAGEYRRLAPISQPVRPSVPQSNPEHVYDIKYYTRDARRSELSGGTVVLEKSRIDPRTVEVGQEAATPGTPYRWGTKLRSILDNEGNGYTI